MIMTRAIALLFAAVAMLGAPHAAAQVDNDLQRQIDALKEQVRRKDIDLQVLAAKVTDLEAKLAECERKGERRSAPAHAARTVRACSWGPPHAARGARTRCAPRTE